MTKIKMNYLETFFILAKGSFWIRKNFSKIYFYDFVVSFLLSVGKNVDPLNTKVKDKVFRYFKFSKVILKKCSNYNEIMFNDFIFDRHKDFEPILKKLS